MISNREINQSPVGKLSVVILDESSTLKLSINSLQKFKPYHVHTTTPVPNEIKDGIKEFLMQDEINELDLTEIEQDEMAKELTDMILEDMRLLKERKK